MRPTAVYLPRRRMRDGVCCIAPAAAVKSAFICTSVPLGADDGDGANVTIAVTAARRRRHSSLISSNPQLACDIKDRNDAVPLLGLPAAAAVAASSAAAAAYRGIWSGAPVVELPPSAVRLPVRPSCRPSRRSRRGAALSFTREKCAAGGGAMGVGRRTRVADRRGSSDGKGTDRVDQSGASYVAGPR